MALNDPDVDDLVALAEANEELLRATAPEGRTEALRRLMNEAEIVWALPPEWRADPMSDGVMTIVKG
jgi:hypothetical protein